MPLTLDQSAKVAHLNIRKEGPETEKHLMVDLKLEVQTDADILAYGYAYEQASGIRLTPKYLKSAEDRPELKAAMQK